MFEEFYQVGNPSRDRAQGLGLGLAIVRRTAALLDIRLTLESTPGAGSTFSLLLPAAEAPAIATPSAGAAQAQAQAKAAEGPPLAVLLVDDEPEVLAAMGTYLEQLGWRAQGVADGAAAADALRAGFDADVVVVDYRLRHETGIDVITRLQQDWPALPAAIVTGETEPARIAQLAQIANTVLHKPLHGATLAQALRKVVRHPGELAAEAQTD